MTWFLLGLIQGLTEFLPVSSDGHLSLAKNLIASLRDLPPDQRLFYDVWLHVATLAAIVIYFRRALWRIAGESLSAARDLLRQGGAAAGTNDTLRLILLGVTASVPTAAIGLLIKDMVEVWAQSNRIIALCWLANGVILLLAAKKGLGSPETPEQAAADQEPYRYTDLGFLGALLVGVAQGLAVLPGVSRSGLTLSALLLLGVRGRRAVFFSFFLATPAILGATLLSYKDLEEPVRMGAEALAIGFVAAFAFGLAALDLLNRALRSRWFPAFAYYCWAAAAVAWFIG